jgi:hypothetical protein
MFGADRLAARQMDGMILALDAYRVSGLSLRV